MGVRFSRERLFRGSYAMCDAPLGHIQTHAPNSDYTYDANIRFVSTHSIGGSAEATMEIQYGTGVKTVALEGGEEFVSDIPVVSHEIGQYFIYPDYSEIEKYIGVLKPYNLEIFRERLERAGLLHLADRYFSASGRFAADCYKNEIETALRSRELSGFQLLDLQDFPGQGTALVGVLNAFMESKGVISPKEWRQFCSDRVILGCLPKFVFASGEAVAMSVKLYSYGAEPINDPRVRVVVSCEGRTQEYGLSAEGSFKGGIFELGSIRLVMPIVDSGAKAVVTLCCGDIVNHYDLWIFAEDGGTGVHGGEDGEPARSVARTYFTDWQQAKERLAKGESVLFLPERIAEEKSVEGTYCTDFWNYPMFNSISESMGKPSPVGTLGLLIEKRHSALRRFPSEEYSTAQWYDVVTDSRSVILDGTGIEPIVRTIDNCQRNHSLGIIFEVRTGSGRLLVCTAHLDRKLSSLPCAKLLESLEGYVSSVEFEPESNVDINLLDGIFM